MRAHRVWDAIGKDVDEGWHMILRHVQDQWLELTSQDLEVFRELPKEVRLKMLPWISTRDEDLLIDFRNDAPVVAKLMSLIAAENGRWSPEDLRNIASLLNSQLDAFRLRAQDVLETTKRGISSSQISEDTLLEAARLFCQDKKQTALFWFLSEMLHDNPEIVSGWCKRLDAGNDPAIMSQLLRCCTHFSEAVWQTMLECLKCGAHLTKQALLSAIRSAVEGGLPTFYHPELNDILRQLLNQGLPDALVARIVDIMGFLPGQREELLLASACRESSLAYACAIIGASRRGLGGDQLLSLLPGVRESETRLAIFTAVALKRRHPTEELLKDETTLRLYTRGLVAACTGKKYDQTFRNAVIFAAEFVLGKWKDGNEVPLKELFSLVEGILSEERLGRRESATALAFKLFDFRDALPVAAALAESMPRKFPELVESRLSRWMPTIIVIAKRDQSFVCRAAALRLLGAVPKITTDIVEALSVGLNDNPIVADIARDLCNRLPPPTEGAIRELFKILRQPSSISSVAAARILKSACETRGNDEARNLLRDQLMETIEELLRGDVARYPLLTLESAIGVTYEFRWGRNFGTELLEVLFHILGSAPHDDQDNPTRSRHVVAKVSCAVHPSDSRMISERIAIGELSPKSDAIEKQRNILQLPQSSYSVVERLVTVCRNENYSIVELARAIIDSAITMEETVT
jgi:hypothetical protein